MHKLKTFVDGGATVYRKHKPGKRCEEKKRYLTEREALLAVQKIYGNREDSKRTALSIYKCLICHGLHLTGQARLHGKITPDFHRFEGPEMREWNFISDQEWFCEWVSDRLRASDNPILEAIMLSERLTPFNPKLTPELLCTFSGARFRPVNQNDVSMTAGFAMQLQDAEAA